MNERIYLWDLFDKEQTPEAQRKRVGKNPYYDLSPIPSPKVREEMAAFIRWRSTQVCAGCTATDNTIKSYAGFFRRAFGPKPACRISPPTPKAAFKTYMKNQSAADTKGYCIHPRALRRYPLHLRK